jgi:putative SOS response-associated peptidase YedK
VPWFAKCEDEFKKLSTINAKSDNLTRSKMWREPLRKAPLPPVISTNDRNRDTPSRPRMSPSQRLSLQKRRQDPEISSARRRRPDPEKSRGRQAHQARFSPSPSPKPGPFVFAGIWDSWKRPDGTRLETFAPVTTELKIQDRLALILHPRDYERWLGIDGRGGDQCSSLMGWSAACAARL